MVVVNGYAYSLKLCFRDMWRLGPKYMPASIGKVQELEVGGVLQEVHKHKEVLLQGG